MQLSSNLDKPGSDLDKPGSDLDKPGSDLDKTGSVSVSKIFFFVKPMKAYESSFQGHNRDV